MSPKANYKKVILFIDSDKDLLKIYKYFFSLHHFSAITTTSTNSGIKLAKKTKPNLVILTLNTPRTRNIHTIKQLKKINEKLLIILLSNHNSTDITDKLHNTYLSELEIIELLHKPVSAKHLLITAKALIKNNLNSST